MGNLEPDLEQLLLLKELTKTTGMLHEAQVLQLKLYPLVLTHAIRSEFQFNFDSKEVIFNLLETKGKAPKGLRTRLKLLVNYVHTLLGSEYKVTIKFKNRKILSRNGIKNVEDGRNSK